MDGRRDGAQQRWGNSGIESRAFVLYRVKAEPVFVLACIRGSKPQNSLRRTVYMSMSLARVLDEKYTGVSSVSSGTILQPI